MKIEIEKKKIQLRGFKRGHPDQPTFTGGIGLCFMWRGHEMAAASLLPDGGSTWGVLLSVETRAAVLDPVQNLHPMDVIFAFLNASPKLHDYVEEVILATRAGQVLAKPIDMTAAARLRDAEKFRN